MAYELLAGGPPFTHQDPQRVLSAQINLEPRPISEHRQLPPHLADLIMRCLKKRPAERWQNADEMLAELDRHRLGRVPARQTRTPLPLPAATAVTEGAERRWAGAILLGVFAMLVLALIVAAVVVMLRPLGP
jgi:serine/threonine-protein kinase